MVTDDIYQLISDHQIAAAVKLLGEQMQSQVRIPVEQRDRYHSAKRILETMLQYLESPIQDPELEANYSYLLRTLYEVTDALRDTEWLAQSPQYEKQANYYSLLLDNGGLAMVVEQLTLQSNLATVDRPRYDDLVKRLTMGLLYTQEWSDEVASSLDQLDDYVQQATLTAVTLALLRSWHWGKLCWLLDMLMKTQGEQTMVRIRAVVGVLLVGEIYHSRLLLYEEQLPYTLQQIGEAITLEEYDMIWSHRLRMKYTPQVVEYVQKLFGRFNSPEFQQRFQEIIASTGDSEGPATFESVFGDEEELLPLVDDVQDGYEALKRLVARGFDVNAFATSSLLQGPFFEDEAHWLIPFDLQHSSLAAVMAQFSNEYQLGEDQIMTLLRESIFQQVDIDFYGSIFRISQLPDQVLQGISQGVLAMENVINRTPYIRPQERRLLEAEEYTKALQGYICQLARIFAFIESKVAARTPFIMLFGKPNPFAQAQSEKLCDKHLDLLRAYCVQTKEYAGEQTTIQLQLERTSDPEARAQLMYRLAQTYYEEEKYMQAYFVMQQIPPQLLSGDTSPLFIAQILYRMEQPMLAISLLEQVRQQAEPEKPSLAILRLLGVLYVKLRMYNKALPLLLQCEFEDDQHPDTLYPLIAWCLMMLQRWDEAKAYASRPVTSYDQLDKDSLELQYKEFAPLLPALLTLIGGDLQGTLQALDKLLSSADEQQQKWLISTYGQCVYDLQQLGVPSHLLVLIHTWLHQRINTF
ncbi:tetratricopeptide repeat protein [Porphyromonas sp.]|uniref:tetratricopeptide repeat protein n=1 Tax=Porphyromonas sp. TaxID=1924944 RepID=UPI003AAAF105